MNNEAIVENIRLIRHDFNNNITTYAIKYLTVVLPLKVLKGSGLGLYIAIRAVEQKGGELYLKQNVEQGVSFICSFPIFTDSAP